MNPRAVGAEGAEGAERAGYAEKVEKVKKAEHTCRAQCQQEPWANTNS